jgi:hypothetical protein
MLVFVVGEFIRVSEASDLKRIIPFTCVAVSKSSTKIELFPPGLIKLVAA